jgi:YNFM family putative membrane transporter
MRAPAASASRVAGYPHRRGTAGFWRISVAMLAASLGTLTALYSVQAVLPALAGAFAISPARASLALSVSTAGLAAGVVPLTSLSAVVGRREVMSVSLLAVGVLAICSPLAPSFGVLLAIRALLGLALAGLQATAMTYLAEELHPGSLGFGMGLYVAGNALGGMTGRLAGDVLSDVAGWRLALGVIGLASLACAAAFRVLILPSGGFTPQRPQPAVLARSVAASFTDTGMLRLYAVGFLLMGAFITVYNYLGFRLEGPPFRLSAATVGLIYVAYLAGAIAASLAGRLVSRLGRAPVMLTAAAAMLAGLGLMSASGLAAVITGLVVVTAGFFAAHSVASGWAGLSIYTGSFTLAVIALAASLTRLGSARAR